MTGTLPVRGNLGVIMGMRSQVDLRRIVAATLLGIVVCLPGRTARAEASAVSTTTVPDPATPNAGDPAPCRPRAAADSPRGLLIRFKEAYECGDLEAYAELFTSDYRFFSDDHRVMARFPAGMALEDELAAARNLFLGKRAGSPMPLAVTIAVDFNPIEIRDDPERPNAPDRYRLAVVPAHLLVLDLGGGEDLSSAGHRHEFHVVRGEAARLAAGQRADADHWYIRKWVERVPVVGNRAWGVVRTLYR
ncbi:MAG TPA: hypothetical protein VEY91_06425 [Candidatus Limnocylindria bacterium]|nr:hypothetical protein [Candidatus Limnocylindria bacterium]